ncbi:glycosyltransferase family 2 protein [Roseobacter weihaiensis]|uniref:glycosyltransferase family 2 protein n=1 Tax=Roseobacter weihaiensis TaxID=2763262 RepID=UPI001D0A75FB|nr:glycosyltransferase family 2 protein [Roseobacter sp. H9]
MMEREQSIDRFQHLLAHDTLPKIPDVKITAIVLSYNEAIRLPHFIEHHAALGVGHFIVVDNGSTDETAEILDADERVTRLYTTKPYSENKAAWREAIADLFCVGKWVLFVDVDELLLYPGWPDIDLARYCALLEGRNEDALFTTMVDMYPDRPLSQVQYECGTPFLDVAPYFDTGNYRLIPLEPKAQKLWPTPHYRVFGGARERLFANEEDRKSGLLEKIVTKTVFSLGRSNLRPSKRRQNLDAKAIAFIKEGKQKLSPPTMSKVPLMRWQKGTQFPGGPHRVNKPYAMSEDWGALLHFKYFDDFGPRSKEAVDRAQHAAGAAHYKLYVGGLDSIENQSLRFSGSRRFKSTKDLVSAGLMRVSAPTQRVLKK